MKKSWILCLIILISACSKDFIPVNFQIDGAKNAVIVRIDGEHTVPWDTIEVIDNKAYYNDDSLVEDGELPLYSEGEERCKVYFTFNKDSITVQTRDCNFIYGGFGVTFDGTYKKN